MASLQLRQLCKTFDGVEVLRDVSLDIQDGEFLTLLGPSGCGKSTLLRIIAGLEQQSSGSVMIAERVADRWRPKDRDVAMVFQSYALYPHMTVAANLALPLVMRRFTSAQRLPLIGRWLPGARAQRAAIAKEVTELATSLELAHLLDRKPGQLSGGQRQRVALARAMVRRPAVFLMDEPLSNLDAKLRAQLREEIANLRRRLAATFVYVTHDQLEAMSMSDRVAVLFDGRIVQVGAPQTLYTQPATRRVAEFIGSPRINMLSGTVRPDGAIEIEAAQQALPAHRDVTPGASVTMGIRPEALQLTDRNGPGVLSGRVQRLEFVGSDLLIFFQLPGIADSLVLRAPPRHGVGLRVDSLIHALPNREALLLFDHDGNAIRNGNSTVTQLRSHR